MWLRLLRKRGWDDLDAVQAQVADFRSSQRDCEPGFLHQAEQRQDAGPAWELVTTYHLAKAAETLFVESMVSRGRRQPIFEMLPPQRRTLREEGLLGSGHRFVVVSLPTSSGKTFIAQLRILQALNQFDRERGWVACLAPTRALVNQVTLRLRRDFADLGIAVEKVSPALEIDGLEADMLVDADAGR